ncbi:MAG: hypothetical protein ACP5N1_00225 [Candidatus Woesearchaeota archaeon]
MDTFKITGFYDINDSLRREFAGELFVSENNYLEGQIEISGLNQSNQNQLLKGYFFYKEANYSDGTTKRESAHILFLPISYDNIATIACSVIKKDVNTIDGFYSGGWGKLTDKLEFKKDLNLFKKNLVYSDNRYTGIGGDLKFTLIRK